MSQDNYIMERDSRAYVATCFSWEVKQYEGTPLVRFSFDEDVAARKFADFWNAIVCGEIARSLLLREMLAIGGYHIIKGDS